MQLGITRQIVTPSDGRIGFAVQPHRWVVEQIVASNPKTNWTHLRIDTFQNTIEIKVNKRSYIRITDKSFGEKGSVSLHTHKVAAQFRNLGVYEIHR